MKLQDALKQINEAKARQTGEPFAVYLACSFTPLHLKTFLTAHVAANMPHRRISCDVGLYGDLVVSLESPKVRASDVVTVVLEWPDLDQRLGYRRLGGWGAAQVADIVKDAEARLGRIAALVEGISGETRVVVSTPSLELPPIFLNGRGQAGPYEWQLHRLVADFAARCAAHERVTVVNPCALNELSLPTNRHDIRGELSADFPYRQDHAAALADALSRLACPRPPLKGLITDLDDVMWRGLVGEVGPDGVFWDLDHHSQSHGLYQQLLQSLAESGTLIAFASKNSTEPVAKAFQRPDMMVRSDRIFPQIATWGPKSESVAEILRVWNIGADSVVFVDDSPMELGEVQARFPGIRTMHFKTNEDAAVLKLIKELRDLFGKNAVTAEDRLRLDSIRESSERERAFADSGQSQNDFLSAAAANIIVDFKKEPIDARALELINKTNQFNLNGRRVDDGEWKRLLALSESFLMTVSYTDKFGALGKIAVVAGMVDADNVAISHWVMSCRAFSRRVEHQSLKVLFERFGVKRVTLDFESTGRNGPTEEFLSQIVPELSSGRLEVAKDDFLATCPELSHSVSEHG